MENPLQDEYQQWDPCITNIATQKLIQTQISKGTMNLQRANPK